MSGLHRLFNTTPSLLSSQATKTLESVTEDAHTFDLLYPEPHTLRQTQHHAYPLKTCNPSFAAHAATSHDDRGGLDIQIQDVRIIIAQDGNALAQQPRVLYDSQPSQPSPVTRQSLQAPPEDIEVSGNLPETKAKRRNSTAQESQASYMLAHSRSSPIAQTQRSSPVSSPRSPEPEFRGAFSNPKLRRSRPTSSGGESKQTRAARERREETEALLGCMFGSTGLPTLSSTKLHVKPARSPDAITNGVTSPIGYDAVSSSRFPRRRTPLTRSTTMDELRTIPALSEEDTQIGWAPNKSSMLITRIFTVGPSIPTPVSDEDGESKCSNFASTRPTDNSHQPKLSVITTGTEKPKQVKTPTFAIAIALQLPSDRHRSSTHAPQEPHPPHNQHHIYQPPRQLDQWPWEEVPFANDFMDDIDRSIENVMGHWKVLNRVVYSLEIFARGKIRTLLERFELSQAMVPAPIPVNLVETPPGVKPKRPKQPTQRTIQLPSGALQQCDSTKKESEIAANRVALALKTRKVIAGQGRWGIWREEARWVDRWTGRKEQNFFFFNLLTAFLGTHLDWLEVLGPYHRRRRGKPTYQLRKDVSVVQHRSIIISTDKMAARRLIFLLSAFLPNTHINSFLEEAYRPHSPWSSSMAGYSQSPPSSQLSVLKEQSLRRSINRRQLGYRAGPNFKPHTRNVSFSDPDPYNPGLSSSIRSIQQHGRRSSDATSIRSLPVPIFSSGSLGKSGFSTIPPLHHDASVPVPHFSSLSPEPLLGTSAEARPGSSGSFASISLKHTLQRSESAGTGNTSTDSSRWTNMFSFWGMRRGSSTDGSDALSSQDSLGISGIARERRALRPQIGKLAQMVEEVDKMSEVRPINQGMANFLKSQTPTSVPILQDTANLIMPERATPAKNIPERPKVVDFPMKLSVNEKYGVVDIDLNMTSPFSSSVASSFSSPRATHTGASSFSESLLYGRPRAEAAPPLEPASDVAGWLKNFQPDFILQAIKPYRDLNQDIQHAMRSEPIQPPPAGEGWTDICMTLIADAQSFSITRLTLRRRNVPSSNTTSSLSQPPSQIEEEFISEPIMDMDPTLIDAVEQILGQSTHSSRIQSRTASPSRNGCEAPLLEVPRSECGRWILGALDQVARSVAEEQTPTQAGQARPVGGRAAAGSEPADTGAVELDSTLREGVRRWYNACSWV